MTPPVIGKIASLNVAGVSTEVPPMPLEPPPPPDPPPCSDEEPPGVGELVGVGVGEVEGQPQDRKSVV